MNTTVPFRCEHPRLSGAVLPTNLCQRALPLCVLALFLWNIPAFGQIPAWVNQPQAPNLTGGNDDARAFVRDASGNTYLTGNFSGTADFDPGPGVANLTSAGGTDIFLAKYDASGNYVWAKRMGGAGNDAGSSIALDANGYFYLTGYFSGTAAFGGFTRTSAGSIDIFVANCLPTGDVYWVERIGSADADAGTGIALNGANIYLTGYFSGTANFDLLGGSSGNMTSAGSTDIFIAKYTSLGLYTWSRRIGGTGNDAANGLAVDASANTHITGYFSGANVDFNPGAGTNNLSSAGGQDIFIAKYSDAGSYTWARRVGGAGEDAGQNLVVDASGNVHATGAFQGSNVDFDPGAATANLSSAGSNDIFFAKYNASGNYVWAKSVGGTGNDAGLNLALDGTNLLVTGFFSGSNVDFNPGAGTASLNSAGGLDVFIAKYDVSGGYVWANRLGSATDDAGNAVAADAGGNVYAAGRFSGAADFDPGAGASNRSAGFNDAFLLRWTSTAGFTWAINFGAYGAQPLAMECRAVARDASGNVYATGSFQGINVDFNPGAGTAYLGSAGGSDVFLAKYDASGNYLWAKRIGDTGDETAYGLALDAGGNAHVTGYFSGTADFDPGAGTANLVSAGGQDIFLAKYDASGNYLWAKRVGGTTDDAGRGVALDASGNVYIAGTFQGSNVDFDPGAGTANLGSTGGTDIFIARYDAAGNYSWAKRMGGSAHDSGNGLVVGGGGNVIVTGAFAGATVDFDPNAGTANLNSAGGTDIFLAKYDGSGNYLWAKNIGGTSDDEGRGLAVDASGNLFLTGAFQGSNVDFDPGAGTQNLGSAGGRDIFVAGYDLNAACLWARQIGGAGDDSGNGLALDDNGYVLVTGSFQGNNIDFDPGAGTVNLNSAGSADIFIARYNALGTFKQAMQAGSTGADLGYCIVKSGTAALVAGGIFDETVDFNPGAGATTRTATASAGDAFIAHYTGFLTTPEIGLEGNSQAIADGDNSPATADNTDFGLQSACNGTPVKTYTIKNTGAGPLTVTAITVGGAHAADFTVGGIALPAAVPVSGVTTFNVTFAYGAPGPRTATLNIASDDPDENPYDFAIQGTGVDPELNLTGNGQSIADGDNTPSTADGTLFGDVCLNGNATRTFTLQNTGTAALTISSISSSSAQFFILGAPAAVNAGSSATFTVTFVPSFTGTHNATISINNNDCNESVYDFAVEGTGTYPEANLLGNGQVIVVGDNTPSAADSTDFGNVSITGSVARSFTLQNTGATPLTIASITSSNARFSIGGARFLVNAGSSATFTVAFSPTSGGVQNSTIVINNSDCDEGEYSFAVTGAGIPFSLGAYPNTAMTAGANTSVLPNAAPSAARLSVRTHAGFTGLLNIDPVTGGIRVTNAKQAGTYTVTVTAHGIGTNTATTFALTVNNPGCGQGEFVAAANVVTGSFPYDVAVGDFNGDGNQDLVVALETDNAAAVRLGDGLGGFSSAANVPVGVQPRDVVVGDFNGDGKQDLAVNNYAPGTISIHLGTGSGGFSSAGTLPAYYLNDFVAGDFNNDGKQDLALANEFTSQINIRLGDGLGGFINGNNLALASNIHSVAVGDFNGDGNQDLAVTIRGSNQIAIRLGDGAGGFSSAANVPTGTLPKDVVVGDFNGDGKQDLATANSGAGTVSVRLGNGLGGFSGTTEVTVGLEVLRLAVGDFNGDGRQDLLAANNSANTVSVRLGDGFGGFSGASDLIVGMNPRSVAAGDFNNDGKFDFAASCSSQSLLAIRLGIGTDINIQGNGATIADGDNTPSTADHTDFGNVNVDAGFTRTFTIQNTGTDTLNIGSFSSNNARFAVNGAPATLLGGGSATFTVTFTPTAAGAQNATVTISSNDCAEASYDFVVTGTGVLPALGAYSNASVAAGNSIAISPSAPPSGTVRLSVGTHSRFTGLWSADPATGLVRVANAGPAGVYPVTVTAYGNGTATATATFTLTVAGPPCSQGVFSSAANVAVGSQPLGVAVADFNNDGKLDLATANFSSSTVSIRLGDGLGGFSGGANFTAGSNPRFVAAGDFNSDGKMDFAACNLSSANVSVRLGNGQGGFGGATNFSVGSFPTGIVLSDFNRDGVPDFATANYSANTVSVRLGDGLGGFGAATNVAVGTGPSDIVAGDFNGDGMPDFATANYTSSDVSVRLGNGLGGFSNAANVSAGSNPQGLATGDFNGDGQADLAVANYSANTVSIRLGNGAGGFSGTTNVAAGSQPYGITAGDFNGDGKADLAVANSGASSVTVRLGDGLGNFGLSNTVSVGSNPYSVAAGDFDGDGKLDLAAVGSNANTVSVRLGAVAEINIQGNGTTISAGDASPSAADHTDFGSVNLGTGFARTFTVQNTGTGSLRISSISSDNGLFTVSGAPATVSAGSSAAFQVTFSPTATGVQHATITINNDDCDEAVYNFTVTATGIPAFAFGSYPNASLGTGGNTAVLPTLPPSAGVVRMSVSAHTNFSGVLSLDAATGVLRVTNAKPAGTYTVTVTAFGGGSVTASPSFTLTVTNPPCSGGNFSSAANVAAGTNPYDVAVGDFDGDGKQDLAIVNFGANTVSVRSGDGLGGFSGSANVAVGGGAFAAVAGDFNTDGKQDLAVANNAVATLSIRLGNGLGGFSHAPDVPVGSGPFSLASGDFNGDGRTDLAVANNASNTVSVRLGDGLGGFSGTTEITGGSGPTGVAVGDFNGDGKHDLAIANNTAASVSIRLGDGLGGFGGATNIAVGAGPSDIAVGDLNGDGAPDFITANTSANTVSVRLGDGLGGFSGSTNVAVGATPYRLALGDFNGDGAPDFAVTNYNAGSVSLRLGNGLGGFNAVPDLSVGTNPHGIAAGDFNGDGRMDFATANTGANTASVRLGIAADANVHGNGVNIADGDNTPAAADFTDFGIVPVSGSLTRTFTLQNTGTTVLNIGSITSGSAQFVVSGAPTTVNAGSAATFSVAFAPSVAGIYTTDITINNDDCDEAVYNFAVTGSTPPALGTYPNTSVAAGGNTVITPGVPARAVVRLNVQAPPAFKGVLTTDPATGVIRVTNARQAGVYTVTLTAFGMGTLTTTASFTLTVTNPACSQGGFGGVSFLTVGSKPSKMAVGDFNEDGHQDLAVSNYNSNSVSICLGNGLGSFGGTTSRSVGTNPTAVVVGDFNGDSHQDIAAANYSSNYVSVQLGNGAGGFVNTSNVSVGTTATDLALGDFNGDGNPDLAVGISLSNVVTVHLGNGLGGFGSATAVAIGGSPIKIMVGDFNGDGKQDFAAVNSQSTVSIRLGDGLGGFNNAPDVATGTYPNAATGDLNADGNLDLVLTSQNSTAVAVRFGDGLGGFGAPANVSVAATAVDAAVGDFNGDGNQDFITSSYSGGSASVRLGNGLGGFSGSIDIPSGTFPYLIETGDFNEDGKLDFGTVATNANLVYLHLGVEAKINVQGNGANIADGDHTPALADHTDFGNVNGTFARTFTIQNTGEFVLNIGSVTSSNAQFVVSGAPATVNAGNSATFTVTFTATTGGISNATISINNGDCDAPVYDFALRGTGVLTTLGSYPNASVTAGGNITITPGMPPSAALRMSLETQPGFTGILDADPATGVVRVTNAQPAGVYTVTVTANGNAPAASTATFTLTVTDPGCSQGGFSSAADVTVGTQPYGIAVGDFNGDGKQDLATANYFSSTVSIRLGNGVGGFSGATEVPVGGFGANPQYVVVGDFNGDGKQDFATCNSGSNTVSVRLGNGLGGFSGSTELVIGSYPFSMAVGDFNADGHSDFAISKDDNTVAIRLGDGLGGFSGSGNVAVGGWPVEIAVSDFNGDGNPDLATANLLSHTVSVRLGDGLGGFSGSTEVPVGTYPFSLAAGDFNADGKPDFVAANNGAGTVSVRLGDGLGGFSGSTHLAVGASPRFVRTGDFNGDGKEDFIVVNTGDQSVTMLPGDGLGGFGDPKILFTGASPYAVATGDFNADGKLDVGTTRYDANLVYVRLGAEAEVNLQGNGTDIADGDNTPSAADHTDFGTVIENSSLARAFAIQNTGAAAITIGSITSNNARFAVSGAPATVNAGSSATFTITFSPTATGGQNAVIAINNDDCSEGLYDFALTGTGAACNGPAFSDCPGEPVLAGTGAGQCSAVVTYPVAATGTLNYSFSGATTGNGSGTGSGSTFNKGTTTVTVTATNECGSVTCTFPVNVTDNQAPAVNCPASLTVPPPASGPCSAEVNGIDATWSDNCPGIALGYVLSGATSGAGSGQASGQVFLAGNTTVTYTATDAAALTGACTFTVTVGACTGLSISGTIKWEHDTLSGVNLTNVEVNGAGSGSDLSDGSGAYSVNIPAGTGSFTITPSKNINKLNGVTSADATAIQQHLTNGAQLPAPFKRIAADVNKSNSISTMDVTLINQALQGSPSALNQITSWRFVPAAYNFPDPNVPWGFPENIALAGVTGDMTGQDFKGVKLGDVVSTWANPANFGNGEPLVLQVQDLELQAGSEMTAEFRADQLDDLNSFQFALHFDPERLQLLEIAPLNGLPLAIEHFGTYNLADGEIRVVWAQAASVFLGEAAPVFRLRFKMLESGGRLSEALRLDVAGESGLPAHCYNSAYAESGVELRFVEPTGTDNLQPQALGTLDNRPNPFVETTTLTFTLPLETAAELRVLDAAGRVVFSEKKHFAAGRHERVLRLEGASGVLVAELTTPAGVLTRRMVAVNN